ncbi:cellulase family glycosylhydrolase, partial [Ideonella sp.]|uniref:cellulase family glycosylhydrolase n=1 Tax=Ideonella sp. TaxID=1929293 RepID=UPI003BB78163
ADDQRLRLFGVNLANEALFPSADQARRMARQLRSLGFNAVRLHGLDNLQPGPAGAEPDSVLNSGPYPSLSEPALARVRGLVAALKAEGIYVNLNLHVNYRFRPRVDQVPALDGPDAPLPQDHAALVFHPRMVALQEAYARQLIAALGLGQDEALAMVEILNEASLTHTWQHWRTSTWEGQIRGAYAEELTRQWADWVNQRHGSWAQACAVWQSCTPGSVPALISPAQADALHQRNSPELLARLQRKLAREWAELTGSDAQAGQAPGVVLPQVRDFLAFVSDTDRRYLNRLRLAVREASRPDLPVTGTQWGYGGMLNRRSHADMDYLDEHHYLDHPEFPGGDWAPDNWRIRNLAWSGAGGQSGGQSGGQNGGLSQLLQLAPRRDPAKPFVLSEFNQPLPNPFGAELLPALSAFAAAQDWDGLFFFAYNYHALDSALPAAFSLQGDWAKLVMAGASARMFRLGGVAPLPAPPQWLTLSPPALDWAGLRRYPDSLWGWERPALSLGPDTALRLRMGSVLSETSNAAAPTRPTPANSTEPALRADPGQRQLRIVAEQTEALFGDWLPGQTQALGAVFSLRSQAAAPGHGALLVQAQDGVPLARSQRWLLAAPG